MEKFHLMKALVFTVVVGLGVAQAPTYAQVNPPYITIPVSGVASGEVVTVSGANFVPGAVVMLKLTGPVSDSWSQTVGIGGDGSISYPIRFHEEGMYRVEVLDNDGSQLTQLMVSSARHQ